MPKYIALLRGIAPLNPNMHNDKLRAVFESLGFTNIHTVIASGNVIFESRSKDIAKLQTMIEKAISKQLGFSSTTIIRSQQQIQALIDKDPFGGMDHSNNNYLTVTFLKHDPTTKLSFPHQPDGKTYQLLDMHDNAVFSIVDLTGDRTPNLMQWLEKQYGKDITTRTWKTIQRIHKKMT